MADIVSIEFSEKESVAKLRITGNELGMLEQNTKDLILLPTDSGTLSRSLTTGKLGNSNRIMLPKKMLEAAGIKEPDKSVPAQLFSMDGDAFLLIKLKKSMMGIPEFGDENG